MATYNKLTDEQIKFIRQNKTKYSQVEIAKQLRVTPACVCKVLNPKPKPKKQQLGFNVDDYFKHNFI